MSKKIVLFCLLINAFAILIMQIAKFEGVWYFIISYWALSTLNNFLVPDIAGKIKKHNGKRKK